MHAKAVSRIVSSLTVSQTVGCEDPPPKLRRVGHSETALVGPKSNGSPHWPDQLAVRQLQPEVAQIRVHNNLLTRH